MLNFHDWPGPPSVMGSNTEQPNSELKGYFKPRKAICIIAASQYNKNQAAQPIQSKGHHRFPLVP